MYLNLVRDPVYTQASTETAPFFEKFGFKIIREYLVDLTEVLGADSNGVPWKHYGSNVKRTTPYKALLMQRLSPPPPKPKRSHYRRCCGAPILLSRDEWDNGDPNENYDFYQRGKFYQILKKRPLLFWETSRYVRRCTFAVYHTDLVDRRQPEEHVPVEDEELVGEDDEPGEKLQDAANSEVGGEDEMMEDGEFDEDNDEDAETEVCENCQNCEHVQSHSIPGLVMTPAVERYY